MIDEIARLQKLKRLTMDLLFKSVVWNKLSLYKSEYITDPRQILYHASIDSLIVPTCFCGGSLKWHPDKRMYRSFCSTKCTAIGTIEKSRVTNLEKYGSHYTQTSEYKDKVKQTSLNKFGVDHYSKSSEFSQRIKETNLATYGVEHPSQNIEIQKKIVKKFIENYGETNPMLVQSVKDKIEKTNIDRYGFKNAAQNTQVQLKTADTNRKKYGVGNAMQNNTISNKAILTRKQNYYSEDVLAKLSNPTWLSEQNETMSIATLATKLEVSSSNLCKYFHKYGIEIKQHSTTELEQKMVDYFVGKGIKVELKNRTLISPKEIDLYFPDLKLGIEINGFYWHSEEFQKNKFYHLNKSIAAEQANIELWHFWDWELIDHWDIIISKIEHKANLSKRLYARKLNIKLVDAKEKLSFLQRNHIQQDCASSVNIGLYDNDQLVMIATFGKSRFTKKMDWELLRLAAEQKTSIVGGASKLLSEFVNNHMKSGEKLVSYCHRRFSTGNVYKKLQFELSHTTSPGYCYSRRGLPAGSRNKWQKHKLEKLLPVFDNTLSESQNMQANGYWKVWDCGQYVFTYTKP